jgi:hypothetical protein
MPARASTDSPPASPAKARLASSTPPNPTAILAPPAPPAKAGTSPASPSTSQPAGTSAPKGVSARSSAREACT